MAPSDVLAFSHEKKGTHLQASDRQQTYLARAEEAEEFASQTTDAAMKDTWLGIAASYRDLADCAQAGSAAPFSLG